MIMTFVLFKGICSGLRQPLVDNGRSGLTQDCRSETSVQRRNLWYEEP